MEVVPEHSSERGLGETNMQKDEMSGIEPRALGRRLQEARRARGMTQQDVADTLGLAADHGHRPGEG